MRPDKQAIIDRVENQLAAISKDWAWLGVKLGESAQNLNHWRHHRGIPTAKHHDVARLLGWTVEQLLGKDTGGQESAWPFPRIPPHRIDGLTEGQLLQVEGILVDALNELETASRKKNQQPAPERRTPGSTPRPGRNRKTA
jgi:hypothetical protein